MREDLVDYLTAAKIVGGLDALNELIIAGKIAPTRLHDKPGAPDVFARSVLEKLARQGSLSWRE